MPTLKELIAPYLVHAYEEKEKGSKRLAVAVYRLDASDNKFRIIGFVNETMKEFHTTENQEEAMEKFRKLLR